MGHSMGHSAACTPKTSWRARTHQSILRNTAGSRSGLRYLARERLEPARADSA
jgi:hypothetical protein